MARPRVLIIRDGAIGDMVQITPAIRAWSQHGYRVVVACHGDEGAAVFANNPHVSQIINLPDQPSWEHRTRAVRRLVATGSYAKWVDLAGNIEGQYLWHSNRPEYHASPSFRRALNADVNYLEHLNIAVLGGDSVRMELFESPAEAELFARFRAQFPGKRLVYAQLNGSSLNKAWPFWPVFVAELHEDPGVVVITGGAGRSSILELGISEYPGVDHRRFVPLVSHGEGKGWTLRHSLLLTKHVDLVVGPETGIVNAAACWDTPKVVLHSHTAPRQLEGNHWANTISIVPDPERCPCAPCYRIVGDTDPCNHPGPDAQPWLQTAMLCMASIHPDVVIRAARKVLDDNHRDAQGNPDNAAARLPEVRARGRDDDLLAAHG